MSPRPPRSAMSQSAPSIIQPLSLSLADIHNQASSTKYYRNIIVWLKATAIEKL